MGFYKNNCNKKVYIISTSRVSQKRRVAVRWKKKNQEFTLPPRDPYVIFFLSATTVKNKKGNVGIDFLQSANHTHTHIQATLVGFF